MRSSQAPSLTGEGKVCGWAHSLSGPDHPYPALRVACRGAFGQSRDRGPHTNGCKRRHLDLPGYGWRLETLRLLFSHPNYAAKPSGARPLTPASPSKST